MYVFVMELRAHGYFLIVERRVNALDALVVDRIRRFINSKKKFTIIATIDRIVNDLDKPEIVKLQTESTRVYSCQ